MANQNPTLVAVDLFEQTKIRRVWHEGRWFFSIIDVVRALLDYDDYQQARKYWNKLAQLLRDEGASQTVRNFHQLKLPVADGKMRLTDCADTETMLRIIQSIPSPKAERLEGMMTIDALRARYLNLGHTESWVEARIQGILTRKQLTAEWDQRGADQPQDYALLTNEIERETFDIGTATHYAVKGLDPERDELRDSYTEEEAIFMRLGEIASSRLHVQRDSQGVPSLMQDVREGGRAAGWSDLLSPDHNDGQLLAPRGAALPMTTAFCGDHGFRAWPPHLSKFARQTCTQPPR